MAYEPVLSSADGIVFEVSWNSCHDCGYGLQVMIRHTVNNQIYLTHYAHLATTDVEVGQFVKSGQVIGTSGSTGNSTGPHLHFDISTCLTTVCNDYNDFRPIDPFGWKPTASAPVQLDPWALAKNSNGADSWCMWGKGQFANICDENRPNSPIQAPNYGIEIIADDSVANTSGFSKGYDANIPCTGIEPVCPEWWETSGTGWNGHLYRTITNGWDGYYETPGNWAKWQPQPPVSGEYEILVNIPSNLGVSNDTFTWQAHYSIVDETGIPQKALVDEYIGAGQAYNPRDKWLSLGIYSINENSAVYLLDDGESPNDHCLNGVEDGNGNKWCRVVADVVKFAQIRHDNYLPFIHNAPTSTPIAHTPTPIRTPTPNPAFSICEPNETVSQWQIKQCSITTSATEYYLYPTNSATTDADVFRFAYSQSGSSGDESITFYLESIPNNYPYRFEVFDGSGNWLGNSIAMDNYSQRYVVYPNNGSTTLYYYVRVYSENESLGISGYSSNDTYSINAFISSPYYSPGYP